MAKKIRKENSSLLKKLLSAIGLIAFFGFMLASLFFGITDIKIKCNRPDINTDPKCEIANKHLLGLYTYQNTAKEVKNIETSTSNTTISPTSFAHYLVLNAKNGKIPVSRVISHFNESSRDKIYKKIKNYLKNKEIKELNFRETEIHFPGWIVIIIFSLLLFSYIKYFYNLITKKFKYRG